jgi:hypothetical protein
VAAETIDEDLLEVAVHRTLAVELYKCFAAADSWRAVAAGSRMTEYEAYWYSATQVERKAGCQVGQDIVPGGRRAVENLEH